jgi:hypothetical protein
MPVRTAWLGQATRIAASRAVIAGEEMPFRYGDLQVEISHPAPILHHGVVLIDTPGIGSTYDHNTDVTYEFLPQVDAAIFIASVDPPLSRAEKDFLVAIREHAAKLFFILNKVDYVADAERRELVEFLRTVLATELGIVEWGNCGLAGAVVPASVWGGGKTPLAVTADGATYMFAQNVLGHVEPRQGMP